MKYLSLAAASLAAFVALPAAAQETAPPKDVTVTGSVALVSDYRLRGVSQTDKEMAVQGGLTITHKSGLYVGTWASNLSGWGTFGGSNMELDLIGGYKVPREIVYVDDLPRTTLLKIDRRALRLREKKTD